MPKANDIDDPLNFLSRGTSAADQLEIEKKSEAGEEEDEEEQKKPEDKPKKPEDKPKKTKDESVAELKAAKDKIAKEKEALEKEVAELRGLKPLKKVKDYLAAKTKKEALEEADVDEFIERQRQRKAKVSELDKSVKEKDLAIKDLSIEHSEEWRTGYIAPIRKAGENLKTIIYNLDDEGNPREVDLTNNFINKLIAVDKDGNPKTPNEIKAEITKFRKIYEEKTGLDFEAPKLSELIESVETYHTKVFKAGKAKENWNKEIEEKNKQRIYEESEKQEAYIKKEVQARDYMFKKLKDSEQFTKVVEVFGEDSDVDFATIAQGEHEFLQKGLTGDKDFKPKGYDALVISLAKGKAFDAVAEKLAAVQKENESLRKKLNSGLPPSKGVKKTESSEHREEESEDDDPMDFLKRK